MHHLSIVSPVYKAESIIPELVERIQKSVSQITDDFEIILVEDGSPDKYCDVIEEIAKRIKPSHRGELEITTVNEEYLNMQQLKLQVLSRGYAWLDTGTHEAMSEATEFVKAVEKRTSLKIACIEEIAYNMKFIDILALQELVKDMGKSVYADYLRKIQQIIK